MNVLVVKANNRPASEGVSSRMYETFMEGVSKLENITVSTYDVFAEDTPYFGQELFDAFNKLANDEELTSGEQRLLDAKQKAKSIFAAADIVVFAFPLWNLTIPAKLQTFVDYINEAGFTFKYSPEGNIVPLKPEKKVVLLNARGGVYSTAEMQSMEMSVNYMRNIFAGMFGMEIIDEVVIEGHNAMPDQAEQIIEEGLQKVTEATSKIASLSVTM
ncbi:FMN-dependent NADH-azoreductase [Aquibacillus sediminis]|uniref:FMN-dependent NADH-azoreductase n=1 Tax=Aquibacillus sediminis TaxID=2574734 RepID=UPI001109E6B3|nr:FMN-dependent NADH-azoreductase [Aquibacillus sediminis]